MKNIAITLIVSLGVAGLAGCASAGKTNSSAASAAPAAPLPAGTNALSDDKARVSYAIGMTIAHNFKMQGVEVDPEMLFRGFNDMRSGATTLLTEEQMHEVLGDFQRKLSVKQREMRDAIALTNKMEGEAFLATNKNNPGVMTLPDGLQYTVITNGHGEFAGSNDLVSVNYRGTLLDGTVFDSTMERNKPSKMPLRIGVPGWTEALKLMPVGSRWKIYIPSDLAYGERGRPPHIGPNSTLVFDVELLGVEHTKPPPPITSDIVKVPSLEEMKKGAKIEVIKPEDAAKAQEAETNQPAK